MAKVPSKAHKQIARNGMFASVGEPPMPPPSFHTRAASAGRDLDGHLHAIHKSAATKGHPRLNLRSVAEACIDAGLDPAVEIPKALLATEPLIYQGKPVLNEDGTPVLRPVLDSDTRLRTLTELLSYIQPKLKAVEITLKEPDLTEEQVQARIASLLARTAKKA